MSAPRRKIGFRDRTHDALRRFGPSTADELAEKMRASILTIRPRVSELARDGKITDTGARRPSISGKPSIVWKLAALDGEAAQ